MQVTNDMSLLSLISHASVPVQLIMLLLLGISIMSWTYIFAKRLAIKRAHQQTRRFEDDFWPSRVTRPAAPRWCAAPGPAASRRP